VAASLGIQDCNQAGRVNCITLAPHRWVAHLCFGGANFDTLFAMW